MQVTVGMEIVLAHCHLLEGGGTKLLPASWGEAWGKAAGIWDYCFVAHSADLLLPF